MPKSFIHYTLAFFFITALSGVWMRVFSFYPTTFLPYDHFLHAHSHTAVLGWTFIGAFIVFLSIFWNQMKQKKEATIIVIILAIVSILMFIAFIIQGYGAFSISMSAMHIFIEYWAITLIIRILKQQETIDQANKQFIYGALITLFISSLGTYATGMVSANDLKNTFWYESAIYWYLHFQYNGWLYLFLIGVFLMILQLKHIHLDHHLLRKSFWIYFIAVFPGYFTNILWIEAGSWMNGLAIIGSMGQWVAILLFIYAIKKEWGAIIGAITKFTKLILSLTLALLFAKSTMELGLIFPNLALLIYDTRSIVIGYLHLTLLGFVSFFIMTQFSLAKLIKENERYKNGFYIFAFGFFLNELWLFGQGLTQWFKLGKMPYFSHIVLLACLIMFIGVIWMWASQKKNYLDEETF